jgi:hypothetical protein
MTDRQLIELASQELTIRQGFSSADSMRQRDFEYLCTRIEEISGILISLSTIKRIMNGQYNRLPQIATLNALSVYLGYADWQAFKAAKQQGPTADASTMAAGERPEPAVHPSVAQTPPTTVAISPSRRLSYPLIGAGVLVLIFVILLSFNYFSPAPGKDYSKAAFSIRKTTQNKIPNTVVFTYDIDNLSGDSFFIQQSWDRNRRVRIYKNSHTLTDIYYEPGYHTAKLIVNDRIAKTIPVSIPTDSWFFYSKESLIKGLPAYIRSVDPEPNGILGLDKQALIDNKIDPSKPQVYLYTFFPSTIQTEADNFRLTARVRMTEVCNTACPWIMPEIFCQHHLMFCTLTMPGCTGSINAQFGEHFLDGKNTDLSPLACDVHNWHHIEMLVKQKQVTIAIDGRAVLEKNYTATAGLITGLGFHSNGLCAIDSIHLAGLDGSVVYPTSSTR